MTLRRPAAHLRRAPGWRRSGDESSWESLIPEGECSPGVPHQTRAPRPRSAIEGSHLDSWLEHLQTLQNKLRAPVHDQVPAFSDRTASMPVLNKEPSGRAWRQRCFPSFSRGSSPGGSSSLCGSSLGSQESLQSGVLSPPEHRGNWERAHIMQAPRREQTELSQLAPVKIGWLPIQRRVMIVADANKQDQSLDQSPGHVKLKQPITPTLQKTQAAARAQDGEVERSHSSPSPSGVKTWQSTGDHGSPINKQVPEKQNLAATGGDRPVGWQALRRGWNTNRVLAFPGGSKSKQLPTGTSSDPNTKSALMKTTSAEALRHSPLNPTTSADLHRAPTVPQGTNTTEACKSHSPLHRTSSAQPVKATVALCGTNNSTQPSHIQTSSAVTTLIPQSKAGFSSITISSRKVCRSASLPSSGTYNQSSQSSRSPSPPLNQHPMDPQTGQVKVQRKATIVKVTEKRVISGPVPNTSRAGTPPASYALDTVVHRRKATIIKVTEHRESYTPAKERCKHPEYRHSYTEGLFQDKSRSQGNLSDSKAAPSLHQLNHGQNSAAAPNALTADPEKNGALHRSTLKLFVSTPPAGAAPASSEGSPKAAGQRSDRPHRPLSWYGNVIGHTEPSKETVTRPAARKWSFGLPQETNINPANPDGSFISPGKAAKEAGQLRADAPKTNGGNGAEKDELLPSPENTMRRASPSLTLIKAPDPDTNQSPEEVLALNAAAIIANIKLQRKLSKKKTQSGDLEKDAAASPLGNTVRDEGKCTRSQFDQSQVQRHHHAGFVPLSPDAEMSAEPVSLQQALRRSRPDFISRSQGRVRELERQAQQRRELSGSLARPSDAALGQRRAHGPRSTSLNDNLFKTKDRAGKEMQSRPKHTISEVKKKKEDVKKREICLSNRQRVELFKKKLLAQVLHRGNN